MKKIVAGLLEIKVILIYWLVALLLYALSIVLFGKYELSSIVYHIVLLIFPFLFYKDSLNELGFVKGDTKQGVFFLLIIFITLIFGVYFRAFLLKKSVSIVFNFSWLFVNAVILSPLSEEIFHRGLLQTKLVKLWGEVWGIVFPAILFSFIHIPKLILAKEYVSFATPLPFLNSFVGSLVSYFIIGILLGNIYHSTKSVYYAITTHVVINLILLTFLY